MTDPKSVVFLDIDGVLQPFTQKRFAHIDEIPELCKKFERDCNFKYRYSEWLHQPGLSSYDIAAVYYDWNVEAVSYLKQILERTGSKIVLSSSWREMRSHLAMEALFAIHGLDGYLYDITVCATNVYLSPLKRTDDERAQDYAKYYRFVDIQKFLMERLRDAFPSDGSWGSSVDHRTLDILEWLDRHPSVVSYVAIDDRDLSLGLEEHFVKVDRIKNNEAMDREVFEKVMTVLQIKDGPYRMPESCYGPMLDELRESILPVCEARWQIGPDISRLEKRAAI